MVWVGANCCGEQSHETLSERRAAQAASVKLRRIASCKYLILKYYCNPRVEQISACNSIIKG